MYLKHGFTLLVLAMVLSCNTSKNLDLPYQTGYLKISRIQNDVYLHTSFIPYKGMQVGCNGIIYRSNDQVVVVDSPTDEKSTKALMRWIKKQWKTDVDAVIPTHFHNDCLGGLEFFHDKKVPSYANQLTKFLADSTNQTVPQHTFEGAHQLFDGKVYLRFVGEGHTRDNIVVYLPEEQVLFGGCLVKCLNANEGFTGHANLGEWSNTIAKVKQQFPEALVIIPGHGPYGDQSLLDYTIELFEKY